MLRPLARLAVVALVASGFVCDGKGSSFFVPGATSPQLGNLTGHVLNGTTGIPQAPVAVTGSQNGSTTTDANGKYDFLNWQSGQVTVTATPTFWNCTPVTVTIPFNSTVTANIPCTPVPGSVTGTVRVSGVVQSGVTLSLIQSGTSVGTTTTGAGGTYTFSNVPPGNYVVLITPPANTSCGPNNPALVTVVSGQAATANFDCQPSTGILSGTVRLDGTGTSGVTVTIAQGSTTIKTISSGNGGGYIESLPPGTYTVTVTPPANSTCSPNPQTVTIQSNQTTTANFDCTTIPSFDFQLAFGDPPPSYRHIVAGALSETCTGITTTPARPGGNWITMWSGPGTVGATTHSGVLDANGKAVDRQSINAFGTYNVNASVTANGVTKTGSSSVTVTSAPGSCPP